MTARALEFLTLPERLTVEVSPQSNAQLTRGVGR